MPIHPPKQTKPNATRSPPGGEEGEGGGEQATIKETSHLQEHHGHFNPNARPTTFPPANLASGFSLFPSFLLPSLPPPRRLEYTDVFRIEVLRLPCRELVGLRQGCGSGLFWCVCVCGWGFCFVGLEVGWWDGGMVGGLQGGEDWYGLTVTWGGYQGDGDG